MHTRAKLILPAFFKALILIISGVTQDGEVVDDVELPPWAVRIQSIEANS